MLTVKFLIVSPGKKELPDAKLLAEKLLMRRQFTPDPQGTSLMFAFFAQHFTHQFFKSDMKKGPAFTLAKGHGVSATEIKPHQILGRTKRQRFIKNTVCINGVVFASGGSQSHLWRQPGEATQAQTLQGRQA